MLSHPIRSLHDGTNISYYPIDGELLPYQQYVFYVSTSTVGGEGAESDIHFVTTNRYSKLIRKKMICVISSITAASLSETYKVSLIFL